MSAISASKDAPAEKAGAHAPPAHATRWAALGLLGWALLSAAAAAIGAVAMEPADGRAIGLLVFAIWGMAVRPASAPMEYTSLAYLALLTITGAMTWEQAWGGMSKEGIWLIFCGMAMSLALQETSICARIGRWLCASDPSWPCLLLRLNLVGACLALVVPSQVVRCQLVLPIARSVLARLPLEGGRCSTAVVAALVISTNHCGAAVLTGGLPNIVATGALQQCGINITWGFWFVRMAPVYWVFSILGNTGVLLLFTRRSVGRPSESSASSRAPESPDGAKEESEEALRGREWAVLAIFALSLGMWSTDFLHGVRPATTALVAVLVLFCPSLGPIPFDHLKRVNFPVIIYAASLGTLAPLVTGAPGLGAGAARAARAALELAPGELGRLGMLFLVSQPLVMVNVMLPVALLVPQLCGGDSGLVGLGIEPRLGAMLVSAAPGCVVLAYQNAPFLIALSLSRDIVRERHFAVLIMGNAVFQLLVALPAVLAWWALLG